MKGMLPVELTQLKRPVSAYLLDNLHYTFAGFNFPPTFLDLLLEVGISRIASPMRWTSPSISREVELTGLGQHHVASHLHSQRRAKVDLKRLDLLAHGRWRHAQFVCSA